MVTTGLDWTAAKRAAEEAERHVEQERIAREKIEQVDSNVEKSYVDQPESEFRRQHAEQFLEPMNRVSDKVEPHTAPEYLVERVNPDYATDESYQSNCADSARCFERSWRGNIEEAAGRAYEVNSQHDPDLPGLYVGGEPSAMTEEWAGRDMRGILEPTDLKEEPEKGRPWQQRHRPHPVDRRVRAPARSRVQRGQRPRADQSRRRPDSRGVAL